MFSYAPNALKGLGMAKTKRRKLIEKLDKVCREIILIRDENLCQYCHTWVEGCNAHSSHVKGKKLYGSLRHDLLNLKILCMHHHLQWWHKEPLEAAAWFNETFPARAEYLESIKNKPVKFRDSDLEDLLAERQAKLKELQNG